MCCLSMKNEYLLLLKNNKIIPLPHSLIMHGLEQRARVWSVLSQSDLLVHHKHYSIA